eukprot:14886350-Alexandrium_andersonii.AAC.1
MSLPALARVLAARRGLFAAVTWSRLRRRCLSLATKPNSTSPRSGCGRRPPPGSAYPSGTPLRAPPRALQAASGASPRLRRQ